MRALSVRKAGPGVTVQDLGREGYLGFGLSRGGAMDRLALYEGAALLGQNPGLAVLEMAGFGGVFEAEDDLRVALTGAPMRAEIDGKAVAWSASHALPNGSILSIGAATSGSYGYLSVGGGFETETMLGSRSAHLASGLGRAVSDADALPVGRDRAPDRVGMRLAAEPRFAGGRARFVAGPQTHLFSETERERFSAEDFRRDARGNRMGARFLPSGAPFASEAGLAVLSEVVTPGDIQVTGDGTPFVLMAECQTTGGYPRLGTVLAADLPMVAQARPGDTIRFEFVPSERAETIEATARKDWARLGTRVERLVRLPREIPDLLSYQLVSGVTAGDDLERTTD